MSDTNRERSTSASVSDPAPDETLSAPKVDAGVVARSSRQTAVSQVVTQGVRLLTSIVLARLLGPQDFGIVAVALIVSAAMERIKDMGTGMAIIQRRHVNQVLLNSVFSLNVLIGAVTSTLLYLCAVPLANGFGSPASVPALRVFAAITFVAALGQIHQSLLRRRMQFRDLAIINSTAAIVTAATSVAGALAGLGFWALVLGTGVGTLIETVMLWVFDSWRPTRQLSIASLKSIALFSWHLLLSDILYLCWNQLDKLIVSRFVGSAGLGLYTMGGRIVTAPLASLSTVIDEVTFPAFSRRQDDNAALRSGITRSSAVTALITFPLMTGLALLAVPLIGVVLGSQWSDLAPLIWCLAPAAALQTTTSSSGQLLLAKGRSDWTYRWGILYIVVLSLLQLFFVRWGATGVAFGYAIGQLILSPFSLMLAFHFVQMRLRDYALALVPYAVSSAVMALAILAVSWSCERSGASQVVQLLAGFLVGSATYGVLMRIWNPPGVADTLAALRGGRR